MKTTTLFSLSTLCSALLLSACGGGGSSPVSTAPAPSCANGAADYPTCTPAVTPAHLQTSVAAPVYSDGELVLAFNAINRFRAGLGLGLWKQSAALDKAAANHLSYMVTNVVYGHTEDAGKAGFTGVDPASRAAFAGYAGSYVVEELAGATGGGQGNIDALVNSVYHRAGLMDQAVAEVGLARASVVVPSISGQPLFTMDFGYVSGNAQNNASDFAAVYPLDGQTDVMLFMAPETPSPAPEVSGNGFATLTSYPVSVTVANGKTLSVNSFTITEAGQTTPFPVRLLTRDTDPNKLLAGFNAYLVGKQPFKANTTYRVAFNGSVDGKALVRNWSFMTGTRTPF